jgi:ribosomal protein L44E
MGNVFNTSSLDINTDNGKHDGSGIPKRQLKGKTRSKKVLTKSFTPETVKETGMVSKGNESEQAFEQVNADFETTSFHSLKFFIKPNSEKPYEDIEVREYCTQCSYRIRNKKWNFCPKCGSDV